MNKIFYGDILYAISKNEVCEHKSSYLLEVDGKVYGIYDSLDKIPKEYKNSELLNYEHKLIVPGFVDLHLHAPQFPLSGFQMDLELLDWLNSYVFPEESKYSSLEYAIDKYKTFVEALKASASCYFSIFGTIHKNSNLFLMDMLEESNLISYVGKVNMDRNSPSYLIEKTNESIEDTMDFVIHTKHYKNTKPIITPRFIPSCSDELMKMLGDYAQKYNLPIQSHLDENPNEIAWVKKLVPESKSYTDAYRMFNSLTNKTIMAHCVWMNDSEIEMMKESGAYIAHCPTSNYNLSSGIAPIRKYLDLNMNIGLGSDVAGGHTLDMLEIMKSAITSSKMYWRYKDNSLKPLSFKEAFYLATLGGGKYFGKVGSFMDGYDASVVVFDDQALENNYVLNSLIERLERISYTKNYKQVAKYCRGIKIV